MSDLVPFLSPGGGVRVPERSHILLSGPSGLRDCPRRSLSPVDRGGCVQPHQLVSRVLDTHLAAYVIIHPEAHHCWEVRCVV